MPPKNRVGSDERRTSNAPSASRRHVPASGQRRHDARLCRTPVRLPLCSTSRTMMSALSVESQEVRMRSPLRSVVLLVSSILLLPVAVGAQANPDWHRAIPGFKIAGNLYYVGTADLAVYLIATPQGNILINGNFKEDVP